MHQACIGSWIEGAKLTPSFSKIMFNRVISSILRGKMNINKLLAATGIGGIIAVLVALDSLKGRLNIIDNVYKIVATLPTSPIKDVFLVVIAGAFIFVVLAFAKSLENIR